MKRWLLALALTRVLWAIPEESESYKQAEKAFGERKYARARELSEDMLRKDPEDYAALFLLGKVYHFGEGSIPRAYYCYSRAQRKLEASFERPETGASWRLYADLLAERSLAAQQLERYQESCELTDQFDRYFTPKRTTLKGFPMLKMGQFDEARRLMLELLDDPQHSVYRGVTLNNLGNIEFESDNMQKSFEYFEQIAREAEASNDIDPVYWGNAGESARDLLRYDEAEKYFLQATEHFNEYTYSDPWGYLAELYANENRMPEALEALKNMQAWRLSCSAQVSQNKWASCYGHAGAVLMEMGYDEKALQVFELLIRRQDRNSSISTQPTLVEACLVYHYAHALQLNAQRLREKLSYCPWKEVPATLARLVMMERHLTQEQQRVANLVACNTGIEGFILPYGAQSLNQPSLVGGAWACFGPGPTIAAAQADLAQNKVESPARKPYLLAVLGEASYFGWDSAQAQKCLEQALSELPSSEIKMRNRCQAIMARIFLDRGRNGEALEYLQRLMQSDPSQLRSCRLGLPISIESDGSSAANQARGWLYASPRCRRASSGFRLSLRTVGEQLEGQLTGPDGTQLGSYRSQPRPSSVEAARNFCEVFHAEAFAPIIDLSQADIRSIDGSTGVSKASAWKDLIGP